MKNIIPIVVVLVVIIVGWNVFGKKSSSTGVNATSTGSLVDLGSMEQVSGVATALQDANAGIAYSFAVPEGASSSMSMQNTLVKVTVADAPYVSVYFSYNVGRDYTAQDYVTKVIAPKVKVVNAVGETMIGNTMWFKADSDKTDWHVASVADGKWLVVFESAKTNETDVEKTLSSFEAE